MGRNLVLAIAVLAALVAGGWFGARFLGQRAAAPKPAAGATQQLWTCGMHPQVIQPEPGLCPICHMELTPLDASSSGAGLVIDPVVVQNMGLRTAPVRSGTLQRTLRAYGALREPEPAHRDVVLRFAGVVETLQAASDGMHVSQGQTLFEVSSPELGVAIEELIAARSSAAQGGASAKSFQAAARARLAALGFDEARIDAFEALERAPVRIPISSPMDGHVTAIEVTAGAAFEAGQRLLRLADNSRLWLEARVSERDLAWVRLGLTARARLEAAPARVFEGALVFVHPHVDAATRAGLVRVELENPERLLREGMYAAVEIDADPAPAALLVPREAVIDSGMRKVAFVALGGGRFEARDVETGLAGEQGELQVLRGLAAGENVVVSGQFLLDAESRIREAVRRHLEAGLPGKPVAAGAEPAERARESEAPPERLDAFFQSYLALAAEMGAVSEEGRAFDALDLAREAHALAGAARGETQRLARELAQRAEELGKQAPAERRAAFGPLSELAIALADRSPPTRALAEALYVVHCPMAPGSWLSSKAEVENPYYERSMKACGEVLRTIATREER